MNAAELTYNRERLRELGGEIAAAHGVTRSDLWGTSHRVVVVAARHEFWERGRALLGLAPYAFADVVGVNNSTLLYALAKRRSARGEATSKAWAAKVAVRKARALEAKGRAATG